MGTNGFYCGSRCGKQEKPEKQEKCKTWPAEKEEHHKEAKRWHVYKYNIYTYTNTVQSSVPSSSIPILSHSFHPHCAGGSRSRTGDPMRGGSYDGLLLVWTFGNSSGKVRVQRGSRSRVLLIPPRRSAEMGAKKVTRSGSQAQISS